MSINSFFQNLINKLNASAWWVSFNVHSWFACVVVYHLGKRLPIVLVTVVALLLTAWKEYYWDANFETPKQSVADSSIDWGSYCFGITLANLFTILKM